MKENLISGKIVTEYGRLRFAINVIVLQFII